MLCADLNTQLQPHEPTIGTWTNPNDRPPDLLRATTVLGAVEMLGMTVTSSFFDVGPTRVAWPAAKRRGELDTTIDYIAMTSTLKGYVSSPAHFPRITSSDHHPLQLTVLAPQRDKKYRRHLIEHLLPQTTHPRIPTTWQPKNPASFRRALGKDLPDTLQGLTEHAYKTAREHTRWESQTDSPKKQLLKGLREAQDPLIRRAYQHQIRVLAKNERQKRDQQQLQKWATGQSWTFAKPHRLPGPIHLPPSINED